MSHSFVFVQALPRWAPRDYSSKPHCQATSCEYAVALLCQGLRVKAARALLKRRWASPGCCLACANIWLLRLPLPNEMLLLPILLRDQLCQSLDSATFLLAAASAGAWVRPRRPLQKAVLMALISGCLLYAACCSTKSMFSSTEAPMTPSRRGKAALQRTVTNFARLVAIKVDGPRPSATVLVTAFAELNLTLFCIHPGIPAWAPCLQGLWTMVAEASLLCKEPRVRAMISDQRSR